MTTKTLMKTLAAGKVAAVKRADWKTLGRSFKTAESHATGMAGQLQVGMLGDHRVAVEEAGPDLLAVRPLASPEAAKAFVQERMAAYDRLWDG